MRVCVGVMVLLLVTERAIASAIDPMAILRAQMAYIKARDHLEGAQEDGKTSGPISLLNLASASDTASEPHTTENITRDPESQGIVNSPSNSPNIPKTPQTTGQSTKPISTTPSTPSDKLENRVSSPSSVLGSLFELGLNDVDVGISDEPNAAAKSPVDTKAAVASLNDLIGELGNMTFLPLVPQNKSGMTGETHGNTTSLVNYLDGLRNGAWGQFKGLALGYTNWLEHEYQLQRLTDKLPLDLIKKVLDMGDRVNFLHVVGKKVDPGLAKFLANQMEPVFSHFERLTAGKLVGGKLSTAVGGVVRDAAWKTLHQFVNHVLKVAENVITKDEIEQFKDDLAKTSPMAAKGLDIVLNGPPKDTETTEGRSLGFGSRNGYNGYRDSGFGGYGGYGAYDESYGSYGTGGYGSSMGYGAGKFLDPYLILAGLGAAVLLAYLAYRIIVTTAEGEGRANSYNDLTFMDLSDVPGVVHSLYSLLEGAEDKYRTKRSLPAFPDDTEDLVADFNSLWHQHESEEGCVRCLLFDYNVERASIGLHTGHELAVAGLAQLLGSPRSGQMLDEVTSRVQEGQTVTCPRTLNTCDLH